MNTMIKRSCTVLLIAMAGLLLVVGGAQGSTLYWSGNGTSLGGTGNWDIASSTNWGAAGAGPFDTAWVNANLDTAYFGGAAGTVTLGANITVGGLRFDTTGYTINNSSSTLSFGTGDNNILLNGNTPTGSAGTPVTATITNAVGGTGNVIFSFGGIQGFGGGFQNFGGQGLITLNGTSTTGWSGTTTVKPGMTLTLSSSNQGLVSTTGITLLGGTRNSQVGALGGSITLANINNTEAALNRVNDTAPIISCGGNITVNNTAAAVTSYSEAMGALDLRLGTLNITQTSALNSGTQTLTFGSGSLTTVNGAARTAVTTSAITFSGASLGASAKNSIIITGQGDSGVGEIIAPWATWGASAGVQTDYASYNRTAGGTLNAFGVQNAAIAASAESTWPIAATPASTDNCTLSNATGTAANGKLSATRIVNTVKNTSTAVNLTSVAANVLTVTGSSFQNGDAVVLSGAPAGLAANTVYYVVNASGATFQLAATPGGTPLAVTTVTGNITGGITLSNGNNLYTYGILNASAERLAIGGATGAGVLSTPAGGGNLYLTTGNGNIIINAPITDNGSDKVTVVRNGSVDNGILTLSGTNTFTGGLVLNTCGYGGSTRLVGTQSFAGGVILNGGILGDSTTPLTAVALNNNAITVNGMAQIVAATGETLTSSSSITINSTGALDIGASGTVTVGGVVSGSGTLLLNHGNINSGSTVILTNNANTFTGNVISANFNGGARPLYVNSFGDGGKVTVGYNSANGAATSKIFGLNSTAIAPLTFNVRQFEMIGPVAGGNIDNLTLANNSPQAFTINTDLLVNALGTRTLTLQGTGTGLSTFAGKIGNGSLAWLALTKAEAGAWVLSGSNTYSGVTTVSAGTLQVTTLANGGAASSIGQSSSVATNLSLGGATLRYAGTGDSTDRSFTQTGALTFDASGSGAIAFINTATPAYGTVNQARPLTLTGSNTNDNTLAVAIANNGTGVNTLTKDGIGTWVISGSNTFTGATVVQGGGTLVLDYSTQDSAKITTGGALTLGSSTGGVGGGTLTLAGGSFAQSVASTNALLPGGTFITRPSGTSTLNLNTITAGNGASARGGSLSFSADNIATTDNANTNGIIGGWVVVGSDWAVNGTGAGDGPIVALTSYTALPPSGSLGTINYSLTGSQIQSNADTSVNTLKIIASADDQTLSLGSKNLIPNVVNNANGILFTAGGNGYTYNVTGTGASTFKPGASSNSDMFFHIIDGTLNVTASASSGSGYVVKAGGGTLILGGVSLYGGYTFVNQGTLRLTHAGGAGSGTGATGAIYVQNMATLELTNNIAVGAKNLTITGTGVSGNGALRNVSGTTNTYGGAITVGTGGALINSEGGGLLNLTNSIVTAVGKDLTVGGAGHVAISSVISAAGGLIKAGAGTLTLTATNSYTGGTTINGGTLALGVNNSLSSATAVTINNTTLAAGANTTNSVGTLDVVGDNATINLGSGAVLAVADSRAIDWTGGTLNIAGTFVSGVSLRFGTIEGGGLTTAQLDLIVSNKYKNFRVGPNGYLLADEASPGTIIMLY
jgi:fibronectin-binding autotransporter adhesin